MSIVRVFIAKLRQTMNLATTPGTVPGAFVKIFVPCLGLLIHRMEFWMTRFDKISYIIKIMRQNSCILPPAATKSGMPPPLRANKCTPYRYLLLGLQERTGNYSKREVVLVATPSYLHTFAMHEKSRSHLHCSSGEGQTICSLHSRPS